MILDQLLYVDFSCVDFFLPDMAEKKYANKRVPSFI